MSWRVRLSFAGVVIASLSGLIAPSARADEAYLCGPDKVVYVALKDLEERKRTDPCIAAYYGLKVDVPPVVETVAAPADRSTPARPVEPKRSADLKALSEPEIPERVARAERRHAALEPPRAMPGTDYRRVRVLNAAAPDAYFYHAK